MVVAADRQSVQEGTALDIAPEDHLEIREEVVRMVGRVYFPDEEAFLRSLGWDRRGRARVVERRRGNLVRRRGRVGLGLGEGIAGVRRRGKRRGVVRRMEG